VEVNVRYSLMGYFPIVLQNIAAGCAGDGQDGPTQSRQDPPYRSCGLLRECVERNRWFLGDHQGVARGEGSHIEKRQDQVILVDSVARHLSSKDPAEHGFCHGRNYITALAHSASGGDYLPGETPTFLVGALDPGAPTPAELAPGPLIG
jgi:hypothetical protein